MWAWAPGWEWVSLASGAVGAETREAAEASTSGVATTQTDGGSGTSQLTAASGFSDAVQRLTDISDPAAWWNNVVDIATHQGIQLATNVVGALAILVIGRWLARWLTKLVGRLAVQANLDETLVRFATNLVYAALLAFVVLSALQRLGVDTASFTAVVAAAGLAVGFALQGSLSNFAAGVMLIVFKPFKVGDQVQAGGSTGRVEEVQIFNTLIRADNNALVIVPNSTITAATITNFSAEKFRRIDLIVKFGYDNDLREVKRFLTDVLDNDDRVLRLPPPLVAVDQLADTAVTFVVQPWVRSEYFGAVRSDLMERIKVGCEANGLRLAGQPKPAAPVASPASSPALRAVG